MSIIFLYFYIRDNEPDGTRLLQGHRKASSPFTNEVCFAVWRARPIHLKNPNHLNMKPT
jgi:hypothetical protein